MGQEAFLEGENRAVRFGVVAEQLFESEGVCGLRVTMPLDARAVT